MTAAATAATAASTATTRPPRAGTRLAGGHLAWRRLATGHRVETWLTWSQTHWAPAVVKLPRPDRVGDPRARDALAREADALTRAVHPGLPRLLEDRTAALAPYLAVEWLDGDALDDVLDEQGARPPGEVLALAAQLAAALRRLHGVGLAHLDLTPANVLLRDGWAVLIDLGAARPLGRRPEGPACIGTAGWCAPELEHGAPITAAMDLYGLGAVLRAALAGSDGALPDEPLSDVVRALLDPDPARRPRDVDDLLAGLQEASTPATGPPWPGFAERRRRAGTPRAGRTRPLEVAP